MKALCCQATAAVLIGLLCSHVCSAAPQAPAAASSIGDTHLRTFNGLFYDFQAAGDFILAEVEPDFTAVSLPSTWTLGDWSAPRGATQIATSVLPKRAATPWFTVASGHVGARDICRVWTVKFGSTSAKMKSPAAWKS